MSNFCRILRQDDDTRKWFEITLGSPYFEPGEPLFFDACWFALERAERNGDLALDSTYGVQDPSGNITTFPEKENLFLGEFDFLEENTGERAFTADIEVEFEPGTYFVAEDEEDYGPLLALTKIKQAQLLGMHFDAEAYKNIAVRVPDASDSIEQNPDESYEMEMFLGDDINSAALRAYQDIWPEKWWRECIQNSVDAGATEILCSVRDVDERTVAVSCEDNGRGMSEEIFKTVFMAISGTTKKSGGTTGGFGKAKELLVLPWVSWLLESQDYIVQGAGKKVRVDSAPSWRQGVKLEVVMPVDKYATIVDAASYITKCYLPHIKFRLKNREERKKVANARFRVGAPVRDVGNGDATIYYDKKGGKHHGVYIRVKGIYMFLMPTWNDIPGTIIVELNRASTEVLTDNRDGFSKWSVRNGVEAFVQELASEQEQALRVKKGFVDIMFRGEEGLFKAEKEAAEVEAEILTDMGSTTPTDDGQLDDEQLRAFLETLNVAKELSEKEADPLELKADPRVAEVVLNNVNLAGGPQVEAAVAQFAWTPDFYIRSEIEGWKVLKKFYPATMTQQVRKLARFWAEMCRYVMILLNSSRQYGVGFVFEDGIQAEYRRESGIDWLLINPFRGGKASSRHETDMYNISNRGDAEYVYALAVHECTHLVDYLTDHNSSFAASLTGNFASTFEGVRKIPAIKKAVLIVESEVTARLKKQKQEEKYGYGYRKHWRGED